MKTLRWVYMDNSIATPIVTELSKQCGISLVTAAVAANRGITNPKELMAFLNKDDSNFHSPFLMKDIEKAVERIKRAINTGERIAVYGDYDVDGITSTALLVSYLRANGALVNFHIPDRIDEGYGINKGAIEKLKDAGCSLIISVDTGVTAIEEAGYAKELGMDVIITDHHRCKEQIPDCVAVIDPCRPDCEYPFSQLAGVGVVFKLLCALEGGENNKLLEDYADIIAVGTIADVVSLKNENRVIVDRGIALLANTRNLGLQALLEIANAGARAITTTTVGFALAPRINAAGRVGNAHMAVELLLCTDAEQAKWYAQKLDEENRDRQSTETQILSSVLEILNNNPDYNEKKVLVLYGEGWHHGVIGIVASRISERLCKPCILISFEDGIGKGSGRSVKGFNLFEALNSCSYLLNKFGGHELAAGLTIAHEKITIFEQEINKIADELLKPDALIPSISLDLELPIEYITKETVQELSLLQPFGTDNREPVFSVSALKVLELRSLSNNKHIKIKAIKDDMILEIIGFGLGNYMQSLTEGDIIDIAGYITLNEWNNTTGIQIVLKHLRLNTDCIPTVSPVPEREDLAAVYSYIKKFGISAAVREIIKTLPRKIMYKSSIPFSVEKLFNCLDIFTELKLLTYTTEGECIDIYLMDNRGKKVDLESSTRLKALRVARGNEQVI